MVLNDEIHSARDVRKMDNNRVDTFVSTEWGALGVVDADRIVFRRAVATRHTTQSELHLDPLVAELPRVPIVADYAGSDGASMRAAAHDGAVAIVVQAFGGGRASPETRRAAAEIAGAGTPVVYASRVPEGRVMESVATVDEGLLSAGDLPPHRVRVLLMIALAQPRTPRELQRLLDTH